MVDLDAFTTDGYLKIEQAVPRAVADAARAELWRQLGLSPDAPEQWTSAVRWAADQTGAGPFGDIARSPGLTAALDGVCGMGCWQPRDSLGNIPVRFPVVPTGDDRGWHIDLNTANPDGSWTVTGRPHTVLVLTLLSVVGEDDAPTRIRVGSHRDVGAVLGPDTVEVAEMGRLVDEASSHRPVARATGEPGDVSVLHPFTVHAADEHRGRTPRFMAQSPVTLTHPLTPDSSTPLGCAFPG